MTLTRVAITCFLIVATARARAQPAGAQAEVLFREGRDLMKAGKTAGACAAFEQSHRLEPTVTTLLNLAACREKLGELATAWGLFLDAERQTRSATDKATEQLYKVASDRAAKLEPRVSKLTISVPDQSKISGLEIRRDQENIPAAMWNRALPVDGGAYTITARVPGSSDWSTSVTIAAEADTSTVDIPDLRNLPQDLNARPTALPAAAPPAAAPPAAAPPAMTQPEATRRRGSLVAPIAVGASAVALLGSALGFSLWGDATYDDAKTEMVDQTRRDSLFDSANRKRYAAQGLAVTGVGCAVVAALLYLRERGAPAEPTSARAGRLMLAPTASGIGVAGWF